MRGDSVIITEEGGGKMCLNKLSEKTGISERVLGEIKAAAEKYSAEKVILFGSRARGDYHKKSDIDLAVYGCEDL